MTRATPTDPAHQVFASMAALLRTRPLASTFAPTWLLRRNVVTEPERERRSSWLTRRTA